jgi:hypothetical protein
MTIALRDGVTRVSDITSAVGDSRLNTEDAAGGLELGPRILR